MQSSIPVHITRYSLVTPMLVEETGSETIVTSLITFSKPSESPRADCQTHIYSSHEEKRLVHLLNLDLFLKESQETKVKCYGYS